MSIKSGALLICDCCGSEQRIDSQVPFIRGFILKAGWAIVEVKEPANEPDDMPTADGIKSRYICPDCWPTARASLKVLFG